MRNLNKRICGAAIAVLLPLSAFGQQAELVLRNGNILHGQPAMPMAVDQEDSPR